MFLRFVFIYRFHDPAVRSGSCLSIRVGSWAHCVDHLLKDKDAKWFRQMAGTALYLSLDRPTIQFAVSQIATGMSQPTELHLLHLKRLVRYLVKYPTEQWRFDLQDEPDSLHIYCDSN